MGKAGCLHPPRKQNHIMGFEKFWQTEGNAVGTELVAPAKVTWRSVSARPILTMGCLFGVLALVRHHHALQVRATVCPNAEAAAHPK